MKIIGEQKMDMILPKGFLARMGCKVSSGSDSPSVLTAITRNLYSLPGVSPVTSAAVKKKNSTFNQKTNKNSG